MGEFPPVLDLNKLKQEMNLSDEAIRNSGFSEMDLQDIYTDYTVHRWDDLIALKNKFVSDYIVTARNIPLHSYNGRVKDPYHLIEKIIRKRNTNYQKYAKMTTSDYYKYITDLIGCRILLVYKKDWEPIHHYLTSLFPDDPEHYIDEKSYTASYDRAPSLRFMAERPTAHIRPGDEEIYPKSILHVEPDKYYRSLHYIVRYEAYYVEIQVRTLFEEAWGEVDHDVLYPYFKDDPLLVGFSKLINRSAGMSDEMSAYFRSQLSSDRPHRTGTLLDVPITTTRSSSLSFPVKPFEPPSNAVPASLPDGSTTQDIMKVFMNRDEV